MKINVNNQLLINLKVLQFLSRLTKGKYVNFASTSENIKIRVKVSGKFYRTVLINWYINKKRDLKMMEKVWVYGVICTIFSKNVIPIVLLFQIEIYC